jgi:hypothetical protein
MKMTEKLDPDSLEILIANIQGRVYECNLRDFKSQAEDVEELRTHRLQYKRRTRRCAIFRNVLKTIFLVTAAVLLTCFANKMLRSAGKVVSSLPSIDL